MTPGKGPARSHRSNDPPGGAPDDEAPLAKFSRELADRFPGVTIMRFVMPSNIREAREVFIREITSADEVEAALYADSTASALEKASVRLMNDAEHRETIRLAIVGLGTTAALPARAKPGESVAALPCSYRHTNSDGVPLAELDRWRSSAWAALRNYFGQVNGVPVDEIRSGIEGAQIVGAFAPPMAGTHGDPAAGK